jgi:hypothetical protein
MQATASQKFPLLLVIGDAIVLLFVTLIGFSSHDRLSSGIPRMLASFVPLLASWALIGVHVGVFDPARVADPKQLWRPFWAMVLAGPFAAWLRAALLGAEGISTIFVVALGGVSTLSLFVWRSLYVILAKRLHHG